jgi:hypothetical protein
VAKLQSILASYRFWFVALLVPGIVRMKPWNWGTYPLNDVLLGLAINVPVAALVALAPWYGYKVGMQLKRGSP